MPLEESQPAAQAPHIPTNAEETSAAPATEVERPADWAGPSRAELIAAVEAPAEGGEAAPAAVKPSPAVAAPVVTPPAQGDPAAVPGEPRIAAVIRARAEAHKAREAAIAEADQIRAQAREEGKRDYEAALAKARTESDALTRERLQKLQTDPLGAIKEIGWDTKRLVDEVAQQGSPEWLAVKRLEAERAQDRKELAELKTWRDGQVKRDETSAQQQQQFARASAEQAFLTQNATPEKTPTLRKLPQELVLSMAHKQADEWRQQGVPFAHDDIAEYLEHQVKQWLGPASQQVGALGGNAPKGKANGSRTPSAAGASERRSSPKPIRDMSPAEERQALIDEYEEANRTAPGR